jgi:hypothetical protein
VLTRLIVVSTGELADEVAGSATAGIVSAAHNSIGLHKLTFQQLFIVHTPYIDCPERLRMIILLSS